MTGIDVTVARIREETPTVKSFLLDLKGQPFRFKPGQWVDLYVDMGYKTEVGGYSITSSPLRHDTIELAVKKRPHRPTSVFLHEQAKEGDPLIVDGGYGEFYYDSERDQGAPLVLLAGGVGITPLISILRYVDEAHPEVETTLLYSAAVPSELAFRQELEEMALRNPRVRCIFSVSRPNQETWHGQVGRIDLALIKEHLPTCEAWFYLCGPPAMLDDLPPLLHKLGVDPSRIRMERWW